MTDANKVYQFAFTGNRADGGHTDYEALVTDPNGATWRITKRYREFRELHDQMKLRHPEALTSFPGKKLFGNTNQKFIDERQKELGIYMNHLLTLHPDCQSKPLSVFLEIPLHQAQHLGGPQGGEDSQLSHAEVASPPDLDVDAAKELVLGMAKASLVHLHPPPVPQQPNREGIVEHERSAEYQKELGSRMCSKLGPDGLTDSQRALVEFVRPRSCLPVFEGMKDPDAVLSQPPLLTAEVWKVRSAVMELESRAKTASQGVDNFRLEFPNLDDSEAIVEQRKSQPIVLD
eukprot:GHVN01039150.1.p1 GENE.GHVN01039150.1~~GHVN01039150.1.p1  ORF type:complete len:289 (-),score=44.01 GHVN01039150.1:303-1169(-)